MRTLEQYLRDSIAQGASDFAIRARNYSGHTSFFIYPLGRDGDTVNFLVSGNDLKSYAETRLSPAPAQPDSPQGD